MSKKESKDERSELIEQRNGLLAQLSVLDNKIGDAQDQKLISSDTEKVLAEALKIALSQKVESEHSEKIIEVFILTLEKIVGEKDRRLESSVVSDTIYQNNLWVQQIEQPSLTLDQFTNLYKNYQKSKSFLTWGLNKIYSTSHGATRKLIKQVESLETDKQIGKCVIEFMCNPENRVAGSGFCAFLWQEVKKGALFSMEVAANILPLPEDEDEEIESLEAHEQSNSLLEPRSAQPPHSTSSTSSSSSSSSSSDEKLLKTVESYSVLTEHQAHLIRQTEDGKQESRLERELNRTIARTSGVQKSLEEVNMPHSSLTKAGTFKNTSQKRKLGKDSNDNQPSKDRRKDDDHSSSGGASFGNV